MKSTFYSEFLTAAKQGPRLYFAPLIGAIRAIRDELQRSGSKGKKGQTKQGTSTSKKRKHSR